MKGIVRFICSHRISNNSHSVYFGDGKRPCRRQEHLVAIVPYLCWDHYLKRLPEIVLPNNSPINNPEETSPALCEGTRSPNEAFGRSGEILKPESAVRAR
ncbi:hypothetical protein CDAR_378701 [Caerostris darwini]|uniref:Ycf15 n=1 Tax=Caerostris darwini TaxID=1538125 RepID=A0AAV4MTA6_9ARAC|nr:hypothetical protein CDAR_378701 [Caerostris darwini]